VKKIIYVSFSLLLLSANGFSGTIYNNLGPGNTFAGGYSATNTVPFSVGTEFITSSAGNLGDIIVPIANQPNGVVDFGLYTNGASQPGTLIESWNGVTVPNDLGNLTLVTLNSVLHPSLSASTIYWFTISSGPENPGGIGWATSPTLTVGGFWDWSAPGPWNHALGDSAPVGIRLDAAPEPATYLLIAGSLLVLSVRRRRADTLATLGASSKTAARSAGTGI
jgi:hypothetical protein